MTLSSEPSPFVSIVCEMRLASDALCFGRMAARSRFRSSTSAEPRPRRHRGRCTADGLRCEGGRLHGERRVTVRRPRRVRGAALFASPAATTRCVRSSGGSTSMSVAPDRLLDRCTDGCRRARAPSRRSRRISERSTGLSSPTVSRRYTGVGLHRWRVPPSVSWSVPAPASRRPLLEPLSVRNGAASIRSAATRRPG